MDDLDDYDDPPSPILPGFTITYGEYQVMFMRSNQEIGSIYGDVNGISRVKVLMDIILAMAEIDEGNFEDIRREVELDLREEGFYGMATKVLRK